jgi:hypothetical protein
MLMTPPHKKFLVTKPHIRNAGRNCGNNPGKLEGKEIYETLEEEEGRVDLGKGG